MYYILISTNLCETTGVSALARPLGEGLRGQIYTYILLSGSQRQATLCQYSNILHIYCVNTRMSKITLDNLYALIYWAWYRADQGCVTRTLLHCGQFEMMTI